jgi:exosortase A-associated hydrolase 1
MTGCTLNPAQPVACGVDERGLVFDCQGSALVGVLSTPAERRADGKVPMPLQKWGVLVVVGGPQYRVGSHRQFVQLARALASDGFATLRFDVRGMGDSAGAARSFETLDDDLAAALNTMLAQLPSLQGVVLYGLCDGASAALMYLQARPDKRVSGLAALNPWVRSAATQAATQVKHYYLQRLTEAAFWRKLLRGQVARSAVQELFSSLRLMWSPASRDGPKAGLPSSQALGGVGPDAPFQQRMAAAWAHTPQPLLLLLSGNDYTAREFGQAVASVPAWRGALQRKGLSQHDMPGADHTLSDPADSRQGEQLLLQWLKQELARHGP